MRSRASWMSASVGAVRSVAMGLRKMKDLLKDLTHGGERVELPPLYLVEQAPELRIVGHRLLEMRLRPAGGDREHLACEVSSPPLLETVLVLEVCAMLLDLLPEGR